MARKSIENIGKREIPISQMKDIGINADAILRNCSYSYSNKQKIKHRTKNPNLPENYYYLSK